MKRIQNCKDIFPVAIYMIIVILLTLRASKTLYAAFPNSYIWGEMFINFEGGFVRRGLLGQLLLLADSVVPVQIFWPMLYSALFLLFCVLAYKKLAEVFDPMIVACFFISPVIFFLPLTDVGVFGRKDLFIQVILFYITQICVNCLRHENLYRNTIYVSLLFILGMLIHEMTIFYFPLFAILLGAAYGRQNKISQWLILTIMLFSAALLLAVVFPGDAGMIKAICASWIERYPEMPCGGGGISFLGMPLHSSIANSLRHHAKWMSAGSAALGLLLSAVPLFFLWAAHRPGEAVRKLLSASVVLRLSFWPAVFAPFIYSVIAVDFGRNVSLAFFTYLFFIYAAYSVWSQPQASWLPAFKRAISASSSLRFAVYLLAVLYGLSWRMAHWTNTSYIQPGALYSLNEACGALYSLFKKIFQLI